MNKVFVSGIDGEEINDLNSELMTDVCNLVCYEEIDKKKTEVNIYLVTDDEIRLINKKNRDIDEPTDVLSFAMNVNDPETGCELLGEIVISLERAKEQAKEYGHSEERELAFLCLHGMLHLLGYDHDNVENENIMIGKQVRYINKIKNEIIGQDKVIRTCILKARNLLKKAYAPYSGFRVASVLATGDNKYFEGVNIENASYGATSCAERNAIFSAVTKGKKNIKLIVIASDLEGLIYPCGICRQVMTEFFRPWTKIAVTARDNSCKIYRLHEIIPEYFKEFEVQRNGH
jgi:cytidine deaminase